MLKGVKISMLTKRQQNTMRKHAEHHTKKHLKVMRDCMVQGKTFTQAHKEAMKKVGK